MATWLEKLRKIKENDTRIKRLQETMTHGVDTQMPTARDMNELRRVIALRNVPHDVAYGEKGLEGGVPTDPYLGLSPLDLIPTGMGAKLAALGGAGVSALGATAIASKASKGAGFNQLASVLKGQRGSIAWHGSPHLFDKFKSEAIGTGEGAQAYGHGLYLAESPKVATEYRNALSNPEIAFKNGERISVTKSGTPEDTAKAWMEDAFVNNSSNPYGYAAKGIRDLMKYDKNPESLQKSLDLLADWEAKGGSVGHGGALYKTDIPDSHINKMLDWDKPLSEQHPDVQSALSRAHSELKPRIYAKTNLGNEPTGAQIHQAFQDYFSGGRKNDAFNNQAAYGSKEASQEMADLGIPGIKYLDGSSRVGGEGTRNFVVFNPDDIRILERNGQPTGQQPWNSNSSNILAGIGAGAVGLSSLAGLPQDDYY